MSELNKDGADEFLRQVQDLISERDALREENASLRKRLESLETLKTETSERLDIHVAETTEPYAPAGDNADELLVQNQGSTPDENIRLFRSLFRGREDIYAKYWESKKGGKKGYSPACGNEWVPGLCDKSKTKCADCGSKALLPLTDAVISSHFAGRTTVGIYPLLPDGSCYFLAVDFDGPGWADDSLAFMSVCGDLDVPAALERSRSGQGAHVWIFFNSAVPATTARRLGCFLLTETMESRHQLSMNSYDRLFPNQDALPKGGFGNLIALPLQAVPMEHGYTMFVDGDLKPYEDQWAYLTSIAKLSSEKLNWMVDDASRRGRVLGVCLEVPDEADADRPWAVPPSLRFQPPEIRGPFPESVRVVLGDQAYVEKEELPPSLLNRIKRLASFQNPDFYKKQGLRLSTALTPRFICCAEDLENYLSIPRGCLVPLEELLGGLDIAMELEDERFEGTEAEIEFRGRLRPEQEKAASSLLARDAGILVAPPGSGKTVIAANVIAARGVNALVVVHRQPLMEQWIETLEEFLGLERSNIGYVGSGKEKRSGVIDVAMLQSLGRKGHVKDIIEQYGLVVIDECHHIPAVSFEQVLREAKARYVLGLTATLRRRDGHHPIIMMQCGPVAYSMDGKTREELAPINKRLIRRNTGFKVDVDGEEEPSIHELYAAISTDVSRNGMIIEDTMKVLEEGRNPLLLTERRENLDYFARELGRRLDNIIILHGGMSAKKKKETSEAVKADTEKGNRLILATGKFVGEGFDDPRLDTLFLAMPFSWSGTLTQYAGRIHRSYPGKTEVRIYDYVDERIPMLKKMFDRRMQGYRSLGYACE